MEKEMEKIIKAIHRGNAILFVGAGFSRDAYGFEGNLPTGDSLKKIINDLMDNQINGDSTKLSVL